MLKKVFLVNTFKYSVTSTDKH